MAAAPNYFEGIAGTDPSIGWQTSPSGGVIALDLASAAASASWVLTRYIVSGVNLITPTVLVSGSAYPIPSYIDLGDGTNVPLDAQTLYAYTFETALGSVTTDTICVSGTITLQPDHMTRLMMRTLQAGIASLLLPSDFTQKPTVSYAMPITTQMRFPMILLNLELLQQEEIQIGQGIEAISTQNNYEVPAIAMWRYGVRVFALTVEEREFYRDAVIGIFSTILTPLLQRIGLNTSHSFQAANGQIVGDQMQPGAFYAEIALQFSGLYNVMVSTYWPTIEVISETFGISQSDG